MARRGDRTRYTLKKKFLDEYELRPFDPAATDYTALELEAYADKMLREDYVARKDAPQIIFQDHIESRWRREVHSETGVVDDGVTKSLSKDGQTMYNRTHPEGRKVNSAQQRKDNGASFYR